MADNWRNGGLLAGTLDGSLAVTLSVTTQTTLRHSFSHRHWYKYVTISKNILHKKAELPQRWRRDAPCIWVPWKCSCIHSMSTPTATVPEIFNGLLFPSILWTCVQKLKFKVLPIPEIIGDTTKNWAVPGYAYAAFSRKFLMSFCSGGPCECTGQLWSP